MLADIYWSFFWVPQYSHVICTRIKEVLNFRCVLLKFWSFESLLTGLEAAASNLSKWKSIGRKLPGHEEVLKSSRTFCRSFCSRSAFVKTKLWRIQISLLESVMLGVKQNYLMCWIRPITWIDFDCGVPIHSELLFPGLVWLWLLIMTFLVVTLDLYYWYWYQFMWHIGFWVYL